MKPANSIWAEFPTRKFPALPRETTVADVAIVGGGLSGLSAAYHLLGVRPGARVVVLEADRIGAGASGRTTGMLGPGVGQSFAALVKRLGLDRAKALYKATLKSVEQVQNLVEEEHIDCELAMTGQIVVGRSRGGRARLRSQAALFDQCHFPYEALDDAALARHIRLAPQTKQVDGNSGPAALRLPTAGILHPIKLVAALADRVMARNGQIFENARITKVSEGGPVRLDSHGGSAVVANEVIVATAGYSPDLDLLRGRILPVHLQVLVTEPMSRNALDLIGWQGREGIYDARRVFNYFRRTSDDRIVFGGGMPRYRWGGRTGEDDAHAPVALDELFREMTRTFPSGANLAAAKGWTGVIGYVADALPAIHRSKRNAAVLHVVGWCGHGIALSVASGKWVADMICNGKAGEDLSWFRNDLPLIPTEIGRWVGFQSAVKVMSWMDRIS